MSNFVTQEFCERLQLKLKKVNYSISGVGAALHNAEFMTHLSIKSTHSKFQTTLFCLVLRSITSNIPANSFDKRNLKLPDHLPLADPSFNIARPVDLLLSTNVFWNVLGSQRYILPSSGLMLHNTKFGWVFGGKLDSGFLHKQTSTALAATVATCGWKELDNLLRRFWEIEEVDRGPFLSQDDQFCETYFLNSVQRDETGRYIVRIPFKDNLSQLGHSKQEATRRFLSIERRLEKNPQLKNDYSAFMKEYLDMGHMKEVTKTETPEELCYYIPHHAVVRDDSCTTKTRVVFNASMKSDSGLSLNDVQYAGPTIQTELFTILLNFRTYKYVISADISKMYRMVLLHPDDKKFHRIVWRASPSEDLKSYELQTLTYGTASAPYLAIRCLHHLADESSDQYPEAAKIIKSSFYVDDLLCGADTEEKVLQLQHDISKLLSNAGFDLRKWLCNDATLLQKFAINNSLEFSTLQLGEGQATKTLGVKWNSNEDVIEYSSQLPQNIPTKITKRMISSEVACIFDPLGLLGPIIIKGKVILQRLWAEKIEWDEEIPPHILDDWIEFRRSLDDLPTIHIPRRVTAEKFTYAELHGFCDASEIAYGAAVYLKTIDKAGKAMVNLLCAKSKVAPINKHSIARLELCSAVLLAELMDKVKKSLAIQTDYQHYWSDSMDALAWISGCPSKWKTFVANRVSQIQRLSNSCDWSHISSGENPADLISRGVSARDLANNPLWWSGPERILENPIGPHGNEQDVSKALAKDQNVICMVSCDYKIDDNIFHRYSDFHKLVRVTAYILRFYYNCKRKREFRQTDHLTVAELNKATKSLSLMVQKQTFSSEHNSLSLGRTIERPSRLLNLNPFMDNNKLIRVGGRLDRSNLTFNKKHPIILPSEHRFTRLLLEQLHKDMRHCGATALLAAARERFWILRGRDVARRVIHQCIDCFKAKPRNVRCIMGNLPEVRITKFLPFFNVGVDYAGPFLIKDRKTRNPRLIKAYICLFICMATKAIHLEVVTDLTSDAFMACLRRFISRRGKPANIYSDNGTNFVGASSQLKELSKLIQQNSAHIHNTLSAQNIQWHFIPPRAPNFGGLWEAGVKGVKFHLTRTIKEAHLHYEDFCTVLYQIEAILNSRPLCPLSSDPETCESLTPGHFLIGRSLISLPDGEDFQSVPDNRLKHYQRLQKITQSFWKQWRKEYLQELQIRSRWQGGAKNDPQLSEGQLVIVQEDNTPPTQWPLGRIEKLYPGRDGITRVVDVKFHGKTMKRSARHICPIPLEDPAIVKSAECHKN